MADGREPLCLALVLCDVVYHDPWTGRKALLGLLTEFAASDFPCTLHWFSVYVVLTECRGPVRLSLVIVDVNEEREPVRQAEIETDNPDPLEPVEVDHLFTDIQFPLPGQYRVQLYANGTPLTERRLTVLHNPSGDGHGE